MTCPPCKNKQELLAACTGLRSLHVCADAPAADGDDGGLLLRIAGALPQLRALQLRCPRAPGKPLRESHFSEAFVAQAAACEAPGLQLLQVRDCLVWRMTCCMHGG